MIMIAFLRSSALSSFRYPAARLVLSPRPISTTTAKLQMFLLYAPDRTEEGMDDRRLAVREKHMAKANQLTNAGCVNMGGAMLTAESIESETSDVKMVGSVIVYEAETLAEAKKMVESDIYYTSGVWDPERLVISPFRVAVKRENWGGG